ncbi:MAG TPA: hypothetical protein VNA89_14410 [Gemmatimonadaceae bacterium]|nr:hypothetical protein [Gemmatimonadaceae bacterium]
MLALAALGMGVSRHARGQEPHHRPAGDSAAAGQRRGHAGSPMGSGTAWLPDASPMRGYHVGARGWRVMIDGAAFLQYVRQSGLRRQWQLGSTNWVMAMADRRAAGGTLQLRAMLSAEPATLTGMGYPQLLQAAQPYRGGTLTDRQHPHELVSELAVRYQRALPRGVTAELYLAPAGEPAIGPVAYRHRPSAASDPVAPLGHHAQDVTHTSFGVATVGVFTRLAKLEASAFNGRHPDDVRTGLDLAGARLDSYAGRLTVSPSAAWSVSGSFAYLRADDEEHGGVHASRHRVTASVLHARRLARGGGDWSSAVVYGANLPGGGLRPLHAILVETNVERGRAAVFGRAEYVRRTAAELALTGSVSPELPVGAVSVGYARRLGTVGALGASAGARGTVNLIPGELGPFYGSRAPLGVIVYLRVRPRGRPAAKRDAAVDRHTVGTAPRLPLPSRPPSCSRACAYPSGCSASPAGSCRSSSPAS